MKKITKPLTIYCVSVFLALLSCKNENEVPRNEVDLDAAQEKSETMAMYEDADYVTFRAIQESEPSGRMGELLNADWCPEAEVNLNGQIKTILVDFGDGCLSPNGTQRKGKVKITYTGLYWMPGTLITTTFEGYEVNGKKIEGIRKVTNESVDIMAKTMVFSSVLESGKVTWEDGSSTTIAWNHQRKVFLGTQPTENKYEIEGTSEGITRIGIPYQSEILEPLIYFQSCINSGNWIPSEGKIAIDLETAQPTGEIQVDYGNGSCDRTVTISYNGENKLISLNI
ncbi:hypothetical protein [Pararhodonellum marinum]|uniref:hypothetical protein n=1 Tax=Pararhodonellum marinum TaxID=2755358 RepID=UPI00188E4990|nr:hypothetical protein [Pararhodonellum marinum]